MLERDRDELLHLGGGEAEAWGLDLDARRRELGEDVHPRVAASSAAPKTIIAAAPNTTSKRNLRLEPTIQRIIGREVLRAQWPTSNSAPKSSAAPTLATSVPVAGPPERKTFLPVDAGDFDRGAHEDKGFGTRVHPGLALGVVDNRAVRNDLLVGSATRVPHRNGLDADAFGCVGSQGHAHEACSLDGLKRGRLALARHCVF